MFISILYDSNGMIVAAAPTCDVESAGDNFWQERFSIPKSNASVGEVGVHQITDRDLIETLLQLEVQPESIREVQRRWNHYLHPGSGFGTPVLRSPHKTSTKPGSKIIIPKAA